MAAFLPALPAQHCALIVVIVALLGAAPSLQRTWNKFINGQPEPASTDTNVRQDKARAN